MARPVLCAQRQYCSPRPLGPSLRRSGAALPEGRLSKRQLIQGTLFLTVSPFVQKQDPVFAGESLIGYNASGVSLSYPSGWTTSAAESTEKQYVAEQVVVWYPEDVPPREVNVTLLINNAGANLTRLGSFGTAEEFGIGVVNSLDQRYLKRKFGGRVPVDEDNMQTADLVEAKSTRGMYRVEYLLKKPKEERKRLLSLVALRFDGIYNRLYTLTAQCSEADYSKYQSEIQTVLDSFKPPEGNI